MRRRLPTQHPAFSCHAKGKGVGFMKKNMMGKDHFLLNQNFFDVINYILLIQLLLNKYALQ
jgi:hypothetical protein